jgi:hypothetical protein
MTSNPQTTESFRQVLVFWLTTPCWLIYILVYIASLFAFIFLQRCALGCDWLVPRVILLRGRWKRSQGPSPASKYSSLVYNPSVSLVAPQFRCRCVDYCIRVITFSHSALLVYASVIFVAFRLYSFSGRHFPHSVPLPRPDERNTFPIFVFPFICDLVLNSLYNDPLSVA